MDDARIDLVARTIFAGLSDEILSDADWRLARSSCPEIIEQYRSAARLVLAIVAIQPVPRPLPAVPECRTLQ